MENSLGRFEGSREDVHLAACEGLGRGTGQLEKRSHKTPEEPNSLVQAPARRSYRV